LRKLFSDREAEIALHLTLINEEARVVAYRAHQPEPEVASLLAGMAAKGLISADYPQDGNPQYAISQFVVGFWEDQVNRLDRELVELFEEYAPLFFQKGPWRTVPQLRTIPVNVDIPITSEVMPYESAGEIIRAKTAIAVRNCVCRQERQLVSKGCNKPVETCLSFDGAAHNTVASGKGRFLTQEEALDLLDQAQKAGLVLQPANSKNPSYLCACCGCCCGVLRHIKEDDKPAALVKNNFIAWHDADLCSACGLCLEICPMDALVSESDGSIAHHKERCIGCGLCVSVCPNQAVGLIRKPIDEQVTIPANTLRTYLNLGFARGTWNVFSLVNLLFKSTLHRITAPRSTNTLRTRKK
jgi:electron transport complex protein RnfB